MYSVFLRNGHLRVIWPLYLAFSLMYTGNPDDVLVHSGTPGGYDLSARLACFTPVEEKAAYSISLCADIPDDANPDRVVHRKEPGHVFIILQKIDADTMAQVFGFYPRRPTSSVIFKNVRCQVLDNGRRSFNASVTRQVTAAEFGALLETAQSLTAKKYNINDYNCYDYALELFNSLPGMEKIPVRHIKFPFIFGWGGSPCGLYRDLEKLKNNGSAWAPFIQLGIFRAPASFKKESPKKHQT